MSRNVAVMIAVIVLLVVPCAEAKKGFPDLIFVAPEFYELDLGKIWVLRTADELPPDGTFKDQDDRNIGPRRVKAWLRWRGYKAQRLKPKKTAYECTWDDLNAEDTEWMSVLDDEGRRFVFLIAIKQFDLSIEKMHNRPLTMSGYLFDTQERKLLWHGEYTNTIGGARRVAGNVLSGGLAAGLVGGLVVGLTGSAMKFEFLLSDTGDDLGRMIPKNKERKKMSVESIAKTGDIAVQEE